LFKYKFGEHRRPSTIVEQTLIHSRMLSRAPALIDTHTGPFSRTTDGVTPLECGVPVRATQQQHIYTMGARGIVLAAPSIDEGVEADNGSECDYDVGHQANASGLLTFQNSVLSFPSADSSLFTSFDSNIDTDCSLSPSVASSDFAASAASLPCSSAAPAITLDYSSTDGDGACQSEASVSLAGGHRLGTTTLLPLPTITNQLGPVNPNDDDRNQRDVCFHSGRRASDGLVSRANLFCLQESMKTQGVAELRKELESLQIQTGATITPVANRKVFLTVGRTVHQRSFEETTPYTVSRQSPSAVLRGRQMLPTGALRPRLAQFHRARLPGEMCSLVSRTRLHPEHHTLQQRLQCLNISSDVNCQDLNLTSSSHFVSTSAELRVAVSGGQQVMAGCLSDQRLSTVSPPVTLGVEAPACQSQDSLHYVPLPAESLSSVRSPYVPTISGIGEAATNVPPTFSCSSGNGSTPNEAVRRHIVRRSLYRLAHQQTPISPCGEEDDVPVENISIDSNVECSSNLPVRCVESHVGSMDVT